MEIIDALVVGELEGYIRALEELKLEPEEIRKKVDAQIYDVHRLYYLLTEYSTPPRYRKRLEPDSVESISESNDV